MDQAWSISNHASGFTITTEQVTTIDTDHDFAYLALALPTGVGCYVGDDTSPTSVTTKAITAPSHTPQGLLLAHSHSNVASEASESTSPDADGTCHGVAISASTYYCNSVEDDDAAATTDTQSRTDQKLVTVTKEGGTVAIAATVDSFDAATGFTLDYTTVDATARRFIYASFEAN
jgi:hypothetical protein